MSDSTEASERALRALRDEGPGSSRTPLLNAKIERSLSPPLRPSSPDQTCAICLGEITDKSVTDSCFHRFCFTCLSEWSKVKPECPLCKARFTAIYHGIKSMNDFQTYRLEPQHPNLPPALTAAADAAAAATAAAMDPHIFINVAVQRAFTGRFGYRTTMGMGLNRTPQMNRSSFAALGRGPSGHLFFSPGAIGEDSFIPHSRHPPTSDTMRVNRPTYPSQSSSPVSSSSSRRSSIYQGIDVRKNVYRQNLWARSNPDQDRIRESSPDFYRLNTAQIHRLVPWLARELSALSELGNGFRYEMACRDILHWIKLHPINSAEFRMRVNRYLEAKTEHFVHEFYQFAISPYDMRAYDNQASYTPSTAEQEVARNGSDDDMEVDHELPLLSLPFNLPPMAHDNMGSRASHLRPCLPIGRPTRNISGRRCSRNPFNFDLQSFLFPSSALSQAELLNPPEPAAPPVIIVLSSDEENEANESADSDSEVQIIGSLPPLHLRPPEQVIDLDDSNDSDVIEIKPPTPPLITIDDENDDFSPQSPSAPSTSNGVTGPPGTRADGLRSQGRFFRPSYREYSSTSDDEAQSPKKRSSKKKTSGSKRTTRSSKRSQGPKSSEFVESDDDSDDLNRDNKEFSKRRFRRKGLLEEARERRKSSDHSAARLLRLEQDSEKLGASKRSSSLATKILKSKNSRKSKTDDCDSCGDTIVKVVSSPEHSRAKSSKRKHRKTSMSISSDDDSSPPRRRKSHKKLKNSQSCLSWSTTSKEPDPSHSSSSGSTGSSYVEGSNLAVNPKAMSKKAMILRKRDAENRKLLKLLSEGPPEAFSSPDCPPAYRYGEMVELRSPTYCSIVLDHQDDYTQSARFVTPDHSDSSSSATLSMGTESAPPRHFEGLPNLHPSYSPLQDPSYSPGSPPSSTSFAYIIRRPVPVGAVGNSSPRSNNLTLQPPAPSYSEAKLALKSESIPSGPPSIASPSSDSSDSESTVDRHSNDWPELSASQPAPENHSQVQLPSSPPSLHRFDASPIITLDHSPLGTPPHESSSWESSTESPPSSPPRLKSVVNLIIRQPRSLSPPTASHTNSDNTTSDEDDPDRDSHDQ